MNEARVQVKQHDHTKSFKGGSLGDGGIRIFVKVGVSKNLIYVWHGWDTAFNTADGRVTDVNLEMLPDPDSIWDNILGWIFNDEDFPAPITVGDCVSYRFKIANNSKNIDLFM